MLMFVKSPRLLQFMVSMVTQGCHLGIKPGNCVSGNIFCSTNVAV
jgi:hypothetical protein